MSGSDPSINRLGAQGARVGGAGGEGSDELQCPGHEFETVLGSPDPAVIADLSVDDLLDVESVDSPVRGVIAKTLNGGTAGAITRDILRLRSCLADGWKYEAEVRQILGGSITILVREQQ